jgi:hypothetical protein
MTDGYSDQRFAGPAGFAILSSACGRIPLCHRGSTAVAMRVTSRRRPTQARSPPDHPVLADVGNGAPNSRRMAPVHIAAKRHGR